MPIKYEITDVNHQLKDYFRSGNNGKLELPKNPLNILWMLENYNKEISNPSDKSDLQIFIEYVKRNNKKDINSLSNSIIKEIITDEDMVCKRIEYLVKQGGNLKNEGIAITRYKSLAVFKKAVELGVDINIYKDGNYPFRNALKRKSFKIANYLWDLSQLNKKQIDNYGHNILHVAIESKAYSLVNKMWKDNPELFTELSGYGKNCIVLMLNSIDFNKGSPKNITIIKNIINEFLTAVHKKELILPENVISNILSESTSKQAWSEFIYDKFNEEIQIKNNINKKIKI